MNEKTKKLFEAFGFVVEGYEVSKPTESYDLDEFKFDYEDELTVEAMYDLAEQYIDYYTQVVDSLENILKKM